MGNPNVPGLTQDHHFSIIYANLAVTTQVQGFTVHGSEVFGPTVNPAAGGKPNIHLAHLFSSFRVDELVKGLQTPSFVIPAEAGIQLYQIVPACLDSGACPGPRSGVHRSDDFYGIVRVISLQKFSVLEK